MIVSWLDMKRTYLKCSVIQKEGLGEVHRFINGMGKQSDSLWTTFQFQHVHVHYLQSIISWKVSENPEKSLHASLNYYVSFWHRYAFVLKDLISGNSIAIEPGGTRGHSPPRQPLSPEWSTLRRKTENSVSKHFISYFNMKTILMTCLGFVSLAVSAVSGVTRSNPCVKPE